MIVETTTVKSKQGRICTLVKVPLEIYENTEIAQEIMAVVFQQHANGYVALYCKASTEALLAPFAAQAEFAFDDSVDYESLDWEALEVDILSVKQSSGGFDNSRISEN